MSTSQPPVILALGEILWDLLPAGEKQLGGAPANFAYHARGLGAAAPIVSAVGADPLGEEIGRRLDALHADRSLLAVDPDHPTGTVSVTLDEAGQPRYVIHTEVAWDYIPASAQLRAMAERADAVCFGTLAQRAPQSRQTIRQTLAAVRREALRICDINFRQAFFDEECVHTSLTLANVLKLNDEELPVLAKMLALPDPAQDEADTLRTLGERYRLRLIALTRGSRGSTLRTPQEQSDRPGEKVRIVDTIGAGDAFTAALAVGLCRGWALGDLHRRASRLAAYVCSQAGGTPVVPAGY